MLPVRSTPNEPPSPNSLASPPLASQSLAPAERNFERMKRDLLEGRLFQEGHVQHLCQRVTELVMVENNVETRHSPQIIVGDIHGQFDDLVQVLSGEIFSENVKHSDWDHPGRMLYEPPDKSYVFLGDYVDRGYQSVETILYLFLLKALYPQHVLLLRGNHESRFVSTTYGFYDECIRKFGSLTVWHLICDVFDLLPLAALVDERILLVHGGLSPRLPFIDRLRLMDRCVELSPPLTDDPDHDAGLMSDLMWSDPEADVDGGGWAISPRGNGWLFGLKVAQEFNYRNRLTTIVRSHQLVAAGYDFPYRRTVENDQSVITVWAAPNYCYRCGNAAAIMMIEREDQWSFQTYQQVKQQVDRANQLAADYFL